MSPMKPARLFPGFGIETWGIRQALLPFNTARLAALGTDMTYFLRLMVGWDGQGIALAPGWRRWIAD